MKRSSCRLLRLLACCACCRPVPAPWAQHDAAAATGRRPTARSTPGRRCTMLADPTRPVAARRRAEPHGRAARAGRRRCQPRRAARRACGCTCRWRCRAGGRGRWLLDIDYPSLDRVEVYQLDRRPAAAVRARWATTCRIRLRPLQVRTHAVALDAAAGPAPRAAGCACRPPARWCCRSRLMTAERYHQREARVQMLQGIIVGIGLCLLIYSMRAMAEPARPHVRVLRAGHQRHDACSSSPTTGSARSTCGATARGSPTTWRRCRCWSRWPAGCCSSTARCWWPQHNPRWSLRDARCGRWRRRRRGVPRSRSG